MSHFDLEIPCMDRLSGPKILVGKLEKILQTQELNLICPLYCEYDSILICIHWFIFSVRFSGVFYLL